jgi:type VI secretion system protein ImpE
MKPIELFHEARLTEALAAQREIVRDQPDNVAERLLLCDLLVFAGEFDTIRRHLDQLADAPTSVQDYVTEWRALLSADVSRHSNAPPSFIFPPPRHAEGRLEALRMLQQGQDEEMLDRLDEADENSASLEGYVDGRPFEGWRDSDDLLGPVLEVFASGQYAWIPLEQIRKLRLDNIETLRDQLYRPATVWLADAKARELFIPSLYVGTREHPEEGIRTGAGIDWTEQSGLMRGLGGRTFLFGEEEIGLMEFKQVEVRLI